MGSSGTGNFTDYPGSSGGRPGGGGGSGAGGGGGKPDKCEDSLNNVALEDVGAAPYYATHKTVPPVKTRVRVRKTLVSGRLAVETIASGEVIGYLPTIYNYLLACLKKGWKYEGTVTQSRSGNLPKVIVDLAASQ